MQGLRTPLDKRSEGYFSIVEKAAKERNCIFFLECETGMHDLELPDLSLFDASGWLVPEKDIIAFEEDFKAFKESTDDRWTKYFCWAVWERKDGVINVHFEDENSKRI